MDEFEKKELPLAKNITLIIGHHATIVILDSKKVR